MGCAKTCWICDISGLLLAVKQKEASASVLTQNTCTQCTRAVRQHQMYQQKCLCHFMKDKTILLSQCVCVCLCFCLYLCVHTRPSLNGERFKLN